MVNLSVGTIPHNINRVFIYSPNSYLASCPSKFTTAVKLAVYFVLLVQKPDFDYLTPFLHLISIMSSHLKPSGNDNFS